MDETGVIAGLFDPSGAGLTDSSTTLADSPVPTVQPDFNQGGSSNPLSILAGGVPLVTSIAQGIAAINTASATADVNKAVAAQNAQLSLSQIQTQGAIAKLQNATQLAVAQKAYNQAAGIGTPMIGSGLVIVLGVAGLVLAAMQLYSRKP